MMFFWGKLALIVSIIWFTQDTKPDVNRKEKAIIFCCNYLIFSVIPADGARCAVSFKYSKFCSCFVVMHSHHTHSTHLSHTIVVVAQQLTQNL